MEVEVVVLTHSSTPTSLFFTFSPSTTIQYLPHNTPSSALVLLLCATYHRSSSKCLILASMESKSVAKEKVKKEAMEGAEDLDDDEQFACSEEEKKKKAAVGASGKKGVAAMRCCQAEKCTADLTDAKQYHRRHKVCEHHAKAQVVVVGGIRQRFCQQCSRFHELCEFDEAKRSCRRRLAGHNERRRKNTADHGESSSRRGTGNQLKEIVCGQVDDRGRIQITVQENASYKHFQIR